MIPIRCSSLDSLFACTPSVIGNETDPPHVRIDSSGEAAEGGNVLHELLASYIRTGGYDIKGVCQRRGYTDEEQVAELIVPGVRAWNEVKRFFPTPAVERKVTSDPLTTATGEYQLTGTADVLSPIGTTNAVFLDWKSGYIDDGYHQQMHGYAYCIWCILGKPEKTEIAGVVVFLRHRYHRVVKYTADDLKAWEHNLTHNVLASLNRYRPGRQCAHCPLYATCPARQEIVCATINSMLAPQEDADSENPYAHFIQKATALLAGLTPENKNLPEVGQMVDELIARARLAQKAVDDVRGLIRSAVERVGPIPLEGGLSLALRPQEVRTLDPAKAFKIARQHMPDADILKATKISLPQLLAAKAGQFARGEKTKAKIQLEEELREAGAVTVTTRHILEEMDLEKEKERDDNAETLRAGAGPHHAIAGPPQRD